MTLYYQMPQYKNTFFLMKLGSNLQLIVSKTHQHVDNMLYHLSCSCMHNINVEIN